MDNIVRIAELMANVGHDALGQKRKFSALPYHTHCRRVAELAADHTSDKNIIAAGWVHDLVEDTALEYTHLATYLSVRVAQLVMGVTKLNVYGDNDKLNTLHEIARFVEAEEDVCLLKLCDIRANLIDLTPDVTPEFVNEWVPKKIAMVFAIMAATTKYSDFADSIIQFTRKSVKLHFPDIDTTVLYLAGRDLFEEAIKFKSREEDADVDSELNV